MSEFELLAEIARLKKVIATQQEEIKVLRRYSYNPHWNLH